MRELHPVNPVNPVHSLPRLSDSILRAGPSLPQFITHEAVAELASEGDFRHRTPKFAMLVKQTGGGACG